MVAPAKGAKNWKAARRGGRRRYDDAVVHSALLGELGNELGGLTFLLADSDVDADRPGRLGFGLLVQDGVDGDDRLAGTPGRR